jgi:hypothetical protein
MRASYDHHSVPIPRRAVGRVLEIQAGAIGLVVRDYLAAIGGFILATFLALFNYLTPSGARHGVRSRGGSDAECDRANCRDPGQAERVNTTVAQLQAQLDNANWELAQTTIRAPADGYVTVVALTVGDRALQLHPAMSFIVEKEITLVGMFSQNGFQTVKEGAAVDIVFDNAPGRIYRARSPPFRRVSVRGRSRCRERWRAPMRWAARRCFRPKSRYPTG